MHPLTDTLTGTFAEHIHFHSYTQTHTCIRTHVHTHMHTHTHTHKHTQTHTHTCTYRGYLKHDIYSRDIPFWSRTLDMHTHIQTHEYTFAHKYTHTQNINTHTNKYKHRYKQEAHVHTSATKLHTHVHTPISTFSHTDITEKNSLSQWSCLKPQAVVIMLTDEVKLLSFFHWQAMGWVKYCLHPVISPLSTYQQTPTVNITNIYYQHNQHPVTVLSI